MAVARFNADGSLDTSFGNGGTVVVSQTGNAVHIAVEPDGRILLSGSYTDAIGNFLVGLTDSGALDTTFGNVGVVTLPGLAGAAFALQSDGKIIAVGDEPGKYDVARLEPDGSFDPTFGTAGVRVDAMPQGSAGTFHGVADLVIQSDGELVTSAMVDRPGASGAELARFKPDGALDATFGDEGTAQTPVQIGYNSAGTLGIDSDGKIILAGSTPLPPGGANGDWALARYNADGTPDSTFGNDGEIATSLLGWVTKAMLEPSGKIVLAGLASDNVLARFNVDGSLDSSFGTQGLVNTGYGNIFSSVVEQADGKYISTTSQSDTMVAERFFGEAPPTTPGIGDVTLPENSAPTILTLPDYFQGGSVSANRLNYSIVADSHPSLFGSLGIDPQSNNLTLDYAANQVGSAQITIKATDPDDASVETTFNVTLTADEPFGPGTLDPTFGTGGTVITPTGGIFAGLGFVQVLANGQIMAAGDVQPSGGNGNQVVVRYNADGSLDTSFGQNGFATAVMNGVPAGEVIEADGKILVSGKSTTFGDSSLVRFNADGSFDTSFGTDGVVTTPGANGGEVVVQADGKIVVVDSYNQGKYGLIRYNSDGTLDTSFGTGGMVSTAVGGNESDPWSLAVQPDGKIVVAGTAWDGSRFDFGVVRYSSDGTLDSSFGDGGIVTTPIGSGDDGAYEVALQSDGKILVSGDSSGTGALVRYNADGTLDTSFGQDGVALVPAAAVLYKPVAQPNGYIIVGADIGELYGGGFGFGLVRFLPDGQLDTTFNKTGYAKAPGFTGLGEAVAVGPDGDYMLAGTGTPPNASSATFVMARFDGSFAPATTRISNVNVAENAAATVIPLENDFQGGSVTASQLTYSIVADSNPGLFSSMTINPATGDLTLSYAPNQTGAAQLAIRAADPDGGAVDATFQVTVSAPVDPPLTAVAATTLPVEGTSISGTVATFTDADPAGTVSDYTSTIDWGDGASTAGTITSAASGGFAVVGSHVYAEETQEWPVTVLISDVGGAQATATGTVNVADAKLHLSAGTSIPPSAGAANNLVLATFTDDGGAEPVGNYMATIDWGDGATSAGSITWANSVFQITGSHQYAKAGSFSIGVSVKDDGGSVDALAEQAAVQLTPHQEYVIAVYHDVLGRSPDPGGLAHWTQQLDAGADIGGVADAIAHSDEYYTNFVIKPDYVKLLGRTADDSGVSYWTGQMDAGATDQQLEADLVSSDEFYKTAGGANIAWIDAVYKLLLGRTADPGGESYWSSQLAAGQTLNQVAQRIASSNENNTQLINDDYFHYLGRAADPGGLNYWLSQFAASQTNEDVIAGFTRAAEYYKEHTT